MRKSYVTVLLNQVKKGRVLWPARQAVKWLGHRVGRSIGKPLSGPIHGSFLPTYACNLNCCFCDLPSRHTQHGKNEYPELDELEKVQVVDDFAALGTTVMAFSGGEATLDPVTPRLIARAVEHGMITHLSTNGFACRTREKALELFDLGLDVISISIDSAISETHNMIRQSPGSYECAMEAVSNCLSIRSAHNNKMSVITTTVLNRKNLHEIPELVDLLLKMGVDQIGFIPIQPMAFHDGMVNRYEDYAIDDIPAFDSLIDYLIEKKKQTGKIENSVAYLKLLQRMVRGDPLPVRCYAGYVSILVDPAGNVFPCFPWVEKRRPWANIRTKSLAKAWWGNEFTTMRRAASKCRECYWNCHTELNLSMSKKRRQEYR